MRGAGRNFRKPPNRCRPRDISGSRTTRGGERHSRTPVPTARARFVRYSWLPAESRQTAAADMGSSTTRGESGAAEHLRPLPRTACPRSPAESRYATFAIAWLSGSARCRARPLNRCRRILATERCRESGAAEHLCPLPTHGLSPPQYRQPATEIRRPAVAGYLRQHNTGRATQQNVCTYYGLPDIVGRPPKSAGLLPPDIGGRTTRGGENGAAERLCLLPAHNLPSITGRPSVGLCRLVPTRLLRL